MTKKIVKKTKRKNSKSKRMKRLLYGSVGVFTPILLLYLFLSFYYNNHFYHNTIINGVSTSNMTVNQAEDAINSQTKSYNITLQGRNDISDQMDALEIELHTVFTESTF
ncbi:MAG: hypothetical protein K0R92_3651 [Lachnospiraceae bacterium]|nr:hypothetical protein [Lachnospiraceae bacterium]